MGNFASRIHSKEDGKVYNILPLGDMPTVVFGRVIREHSVPGMQYYFSDGRVKFQDGDKGKRDNMSNGGGWDAVIPFTKPKEFSAIKFNGDGDTWLYRRYRKGDRASKGWFAWVYVSNGNNLDISDSSVNWSGIDTSDIFYTNNDTPNIGDYSVDGNYEILDFNSAVTSNTVNPTQLPVIFTVPEDLDFSKMNDVEYVRQFCRTGVNLNANTMSANFIIRDGKIICVKQIDFGSNKILSLNKDGDGLNNEVYKSGFVYRFVRILGRTRLGSRNTNKYKIITSHSMHNCLHNEFTVIPIVIRNSHHTSKIYKSIYIYPSYRFRNTFKYKGKWLWKIK